MHVSITLYLEHLANKGRSPLTVKASRCDLTGFTSWWEQSRQRPFHPDLLQASDLRAWRRHRQRDEAVASTTLNRALISLRSYLTWVTKAGLIVSNPAEEIKALPTGTSSPRSIPANAVDALLRVVRSEHNERVRLRDEALLALLVHAGLRAQEVCDVKGQALRLG